MELDPYQPGGSGRPFECDQNDRQLAPEPF